uniref:Reverse transcriptase domain-containing protein n=1 Tax=Tanacetum cinerariifolium TaxID=118510 RepID=A0A6L2JT00_TANCI|nr:hypothetical protein [Tanacetum cinerariifolium]
MPPRMTTRSAGRQTAAPRGGRTGRGGGTLENQQAELVVELVIKVVKEVTKGDFRSVNVDNGQNGCSYKELMACNPKDYDGKGGAIVYTCWIESGISPGHEWTRGREAAVGMTWEDFKGLMRKEFCPNNELQKLESEFWCHAMVGAGHDVYTD